MRAPGGGRGAKANLMNKTSLSVLVPVYNEESLVAESLRRLLVLAECPSLTSIQVVIVNDGSRDNPAAAGTEFLHDVAAATHPGPFEWIFLHHWRATISGSNRSWLSSLPSARPKSSKCPSAIPAEPITKVKKSTGKTESKRLGPSFGSGTRTIIWMTTSALCAT